MKQVLQISIVLACLSITLLTYSQSYKFSSKNKKALKSYQEAEKAYSLFDYSTALEQLKTAIQKDNNFIEAWLLMGDVYTELDQKQDAIAAFQKAIQIDSTFFPRTYFFIGNLSYEEGDYRKSVRNFESYLQFSGEQEVTIILANKGLKQSQYADYLVNNPVAQQPVNLGDHVNSVADEYINYVSEHFTELVLTRKIEIGSGTDGRKLYEELFFQSNFDKDGWQLPEPIKLSWQEGLNLGGMNLSVDGRKMYFTGCNWPDGFGSCDLFVSFKLGNNWEPPTNLGATVNSQWWDSQPVVSSDGERIYFSSKRSGGKGGSDIWMTIRLENGKWSPPVNLGDSINTPGNEMSPFLHADGNTLYFSSDGHYGLGGADLFISRKDDLGRWSKAQNLGYPVNTKYNEINFFMSIEGGHAYLSSDRQEGHGGFDIYQLEPDDIIKPEQVYFVKGKVIDIDTKKPLKARIELTNLLNGLVEIETFSDPKNGEFLMVLYQDVEYAFNITKTKYLFYSEHFLNTESDSIISVDKIFELEPIVAGNQMVLNNVFFDFDESNLNSKSNIELEKLYQLLVNNETISIEIGGHTDIMGNEDYNHKLSEDRARVVNQYLLNKGIAPQRLTYKGFGASKPIADNTTEEGRAKNRRTEITIL